MSLKSTAAFMLSVCASLHSADAFAETVPAKGLVDSRIRVADYNENQV